MRHLFYSCVFLITVVACKSEIKEQPHRKEKGLHHVKDCPVSEDTINLITTFTKDTIETPSTRFYSIISFIGQKGLFKPNLDKRGKLKIKKETSKSFLVAYDTWDMRKWITKHFIMKNMQVTTLEFIGTRKDRYIGFTPRLHFEEWKFTSNADRDSAMKIVQTAYNYPNNIVMYEKRYSQFILDDKRIYLLEAGAKFAERYAVEYKILVEQFIKANIQIANTYFN